MIETPAGPSYTSWRLTITPHLARRPPVLVFPSEGDCVSIALETSSADGRGRSLVDLNLAGTRLGRWVSWIYWTALALIEPSMRHRRR